MNQYVTYYPGQYTPEEQAILDKVAKECEEQIGKPGISLENPDAAGVIQEETLLAYARTWDEYNPLFLDPEYAKNSPWGGVIAFPGAVEPSVGFPMLDDYCDVFGDIFYYGNDGGDVEFFEPVRPGDQITLLVDKKGIEDITDPNGSIYRRFQLYGEGTAYNAKGEKVGHARTLGKNAWQRLDGPGEIPSEYDQCFAWKKLPNPLTPHVTTPEEWEIIEQMWKDEMIRGKDTLYWEDVQIGDEPWPTCSGPISAIDMIRLHGEMLLHFPSTRKLIEAGEELMVDPLGQKLHGLARHYNDCHLPNSGALFYNHTARNFVIRMVTNWIGDAGFVTKYGWRFCNVQAPIFDPTSGADLLAKVPSMAGRYCDRHGIEGDTAICKGYVTDKYKNEHGCFIDLVCWAEDFKQRILQVCPFTVRLPSREQ